MAEPLPESIRLSIVIPVLNEADQLAICLDELSARRWIREHAEIIVCDGGSADGSPDVARQFCSRLVTSPPGRAAQMNRGAADAGGTHLLFLHVDSRLPDGFEYSFPTDADWGFFRLRLDGPATIYRIIEAAINLRTRLTRVAGGDQGLFFSRRCFDRLNGFPPIPLMEDVAICKQARKLSTPHIIEDRLTTSSRRWQQHGVLRTIVLMWSLRLAYWLGVDPRRLHRFYYPQRGHTG